MRYQGSEARSLETAERRRSQQTIERMPQRRPQLEVVEGAGLDARVREGVSPEFVLKVRAALVAFAVFVALCFARVALYSATQSLLVANEVVRSEIQTAQALKSDLEVTSSMLASPSRIERIATQNYGMVPAEQVETVTIEAGATIPSGTVQAAADGAQAATAQS